MTSNAGQGTSPHGALGQNAGGPKDMEAPMNVTVQLPTGGAGVR